MNSGPIACRVVTPESEVLRQAADSVVLPAFDGELGILRGHAPMVALIGLGEMRVRLGQALSRLAVDGGLVTVKDNEVTVIAGRAVKGEDLEPDETRTRELRARRPQNDADALEKWRRAVLWSLLCDSVTGD